MYFLIVFVIGSLLPCEIKYFFHYNYLSYTQIESGLNETNQNKECCVSGFSSGSIITRFQIGLDIESDLGLTDIHNMIQAAIDKKEIVGVDVIPGSLKVTGKHSVFVDKKEGVF